MKEAGAVTCGELGADDIVFVFVFVFDFVFDEEEWSWQTVGNKYPFRHKSRASVLSQNNSIGAFLHQYLSVT